MTSLREYLLEPIKEKGRAYSFTRLDVALGVVVAIAVMAAIGYSAEAGGWTHKRETTIVAVLVGAFIFGQCRRAVFGGALGIVALRSIIGIFVASDMTLVFVAIAAGSGTAAWLLLRKL